MNMITRTICVAFGAVLLAGGSSPAISNANPASANQASTAQNDPMELVKQGRKLNSEGKQDEALALYNQALQLSPELFEAHLAAGMVLDLKGQYEEARRHLAKAIELAHPDVKAQALGAMAISYAFERNANEASKFERQAFDAQAAERARRSGMPIQSSPLRSPPAVP
jgi:tetratricopeptide (TPR) repeat protein